MERIVKNADFTICLFTTTDVSPIGSPRRGRLASSALLWLRRVAAVIVLQDHAFFENHTAVFSSFTGHHHSKGALCTLVKSEALEPLDLLELRLMLFDCVADFLTKRGIGRITVNDLHHAERAGYV